MTRDLSWHRRRGSGILVPSDLRECTTADVNVCIEVFKGDVRLAHGLVLSTGPRVSMFERHNLTVNAGLTQIRDAMYGGDDTPDVISHGAAGEDGTAPAAGDTALGDEVFRDTLVQRQKSTYSLIFRFILSSQQGNGSTIREFGLFNAASGGTMYARVTPDEIVKTVSISVLATWTASWGAG